MVEASTGFILCAWISILLVGFLKHADAFVICLVQNPGFTECNATQAPSTYHGIDVELIRWIAEVEGWHEIQDASDLTMYNPESKTFSFKCTERRVTATVNILIANDTMDECAMGAGAWTITVARIRSGCRFSYPYMRTGLSVMANSEGETRKYDIWAFTQPFDWTLWVALGATLVLLPPLTWAVENLVLTGTLPVGEESLHNLQVAIFHFFLSVFNLQHFACITLPAQMIIITFLFMILVMVSTYTANLAAALTVGVGQGGIDTLADLVGEFVTSHGPYVPLLQKYYRISADEMDWEGALTFQRSAAMLKSDQLTAYIFDKPLLSYYMLQMEDACSLKLVGREILPFDYGFGFHKDFPQDLINQFNLGILAAKAANEIVMLEDFYITFDSSVCQSSSEYQPATIYQMSGLWIIIAGAIGIGVLAACYSIWKFHIKGNKMSREGSSEMGSMSEEPSRALSLDGSVARHLSTLKKKVLVTAASAPVHISTMGSEGELTAQWRVFRDQASLPESLATSVTPFDSPSLPRRPLDPSTPSYLSTGTALSRPSESGTGGKWTNGLRSNARGRETDGMWTNGLSGNPCGREADGMWMNGLSSNACGREAEPLRIVPLPGSLQTVNATVNAAQRTQTRQG